MKATILMVLFVLLISSLAGAHCDTLGGPVIADARIALQKGDVTPALKWVKKENEAEVREAFAKAIAVREKAPEARDLGETYFFETLVRVHRMGEGAPYTGLKPAETVDPGIEAAEYALKNGSADPLITFLNQEIQSGLRERFDRVIATKKNADASVEQGRAYVEAYVKFIHYVERLHSNATVEAATEHEEHE